MFCIHCGKQLSDDARFCSACGAPVIGAVEPDASDNASFVTENANVEANEPVDQQTTETQDDQDSAWIPFDSQEVVEPPKKKKRLGLILGITIPAVLLTIAAVVIAIFMFSSTAYLEPSLISAYVSENGTAYVCYNDGQCVEIGDGIKNAYMTPNRQYIVVETKKGRLYVTDAKLSKEVELLKINGESEEIIYACFDTGVFYYKADEEDEEVTFYFYSFESKNGDSVKIMSGKRSDYQDMGFSNVTYSRDSAAFAYALNGRIYVYVAGDEEARKIANYDTNTSISFVGVAKDGKTVAWMQNESDGSNILKLYDGVSASTVTTIDKDEELIYPSMCFSADGALWTMTCRDTLYYRQGEGKMKKVSLPEDVSSSIYTSNGYHLLLDTQAAKATGLYVSTADNVYFVNLKEATRSKLVSGAENGWGVLGDTLFFTNEDDVLYAASVNAQKGTIGEKNKVTSDVDRIAYAQGQDNYVYYLKNVDYDEDKLEGDLYVYDVKANESVRIESNVYPSLEVSTDGKTVYYFEDVSEANTENSSVTYGTLKSYSSTKEKIAKIADDVIVYSVTSNFMTGELDPSSMWFKVYENAKKDTYQYTVSYYNGKEAIAKIVEMEAK